MNGTLLFPYDMFSSNAYAYYYAVELARRINHELVIVSGFKPETASRLFFRWNPGKQLDEFKQHLHLKLLELNGHYLQEYNRWESFNETSIKTHIGAGEIDEVLSGILLRKTANVLLVEHKILCENILPKGFLGKIASLDIKLWVIPTNIVGFQADHTLPRDLFDADKKEILGDYLHHTQLFNIPDDLDLMKMEFCGRGAVS